VSGSSEGDREGGSRCLDNGKHGSAMTTKAAEEEKGSLHGGGGAPFVASGGGWQRRHELWVERWHPWSKRGWHGRHRCLDRAADGWAPVVSDFFQFIQNWLKFKNQNGCLILLQKFPIFAFSY
jgi:hypothetical protein